MNRRTRCPEPEQLASLVEGGLGPADRAVVVSHLAECAICREVVGSATDVIGALDGAGESSVVVRPQVPRWRRAALPGLVAAALVVFAFTLLYRSGQPPGPLTTAELWATAGEVPAGAALDSYSLWPTLRGESSDSVYRRDSFRLGALLADLEAGWSTGRDVREPLGRLLATLDRLPLARPARMTYEPMLGAPEPPSRAERESAEELLTALVDADWFDLGRRAEVTRLVSGQGLDAEWREEFARLLQAVAGTLDGAAGARLRALADDVESSGGAADLTQAASDVIRLLAD